MRRPKVLLVFPPVWPAVHPYLSLPCLTAFLKSGGADVSQIDLNAEAWDKLLSPEGLKRADDRLRKEFKLRKAADEEFSEDILPLLICAKQLIANIEQAKAIRRGSGFYNIEKYLWSKNQIELGWNLIIAAYNPFEFKFRVKNKRFAPADRGQILELTMDSNNNTFLDFYEHYALERILKQKPDVVGISIIDVPQIIPGLTLARLIKERSPAAHIVIGGNIFTRWKDTLLKNIKLFEFFDSVIVNEGEQALLELVNQLKGKKEFNKVPNLIYKKNNQVILNEKTAVENLDELPAPDFDGLPVELYFAPGLILPVYTSRGCYWQRCAFCDHGYGYSKGYRRRDPKLVVEDLKFLQSKYKTDIFFFIDELLSPRASRVLSENIIKAGLKINWMADARFEKAFSKELLSMMRKAGARIICWGFESAAERVLQLMDKGIDINTVKRICSEARRAGIWNHVFAFFGFPGETEEEAYQTMDFILNNQDIIQTAGAGPFSLNKYSKVMEHHKKYGIKTLNTGEFLMQFKYSVEKGIDEHKASEISEIFNEKLKNNCSDLGIWGALPIEHCFLYLVNSAQEGLLDQAKLLRQAVTKFTKADKADA